MLIFPHATLFCQITNHAHDLIAHMYTDMNDVENFWRAEIAPSKMPLHGKSNYTTVTWFLPQIFVK